MRAILAIVSLGLACNDPGGVQEDLRVVRDLAEADLSGLVTGSCDTRSQNGVCSEYTGPAGVIAPYQSGCQGGGFTWTDGPCDHTGSIGGCRHTDSGLRLTFTDWAYPPQTAAGIMAACDAPDVYVAP